jgi:subtilisin family serine protease
MHPVGGSVTSEGLATLGVPSLHRNGYTGENVTVAVIDLGFDASNPEIADNVVSTTTMQRTEPFTNRSGQHGTAVAEVLTDTAPNVSLVLISVETVVGIKKAIRHVDQNTSADLVTMSLGTRVGPFDGTSEVDRLIATSTQNGTPYVISAGNEAGGSHLHLEWDDPDGDGRLNFAGSDERLGVSTRGNTIAVTVNWRQFPVSSQDYDIALYDGSGQVVAASSDRQAGGITDRPVEQVRIESPANPPYSLAIRNTSANGSATFDIFTNDGSSLEYSTDAQSITRPAAEETAITVGATYYEDNTLEPFSSRGPTVDGRLKPDLVAPDGVSTSVYGEASTAGFFGTSAAAPHAAGVAALVLDRNASVSSGTLTHLLTGTADDLRGEEPNNQTGYGLVNATAAVSAAGQLSLADPDRIVVSSDGTADYASIQAAIDTAPAGAVVEVRPGTYRESVRVERNLTLVAPDGATLNGSTVSSNTGVRIASNSQISPTIRGFSITGYAGDGVVAVESTGAWTLRNVTVRNVGESGLDVGTASGDWTVENVLVVNASDYALDAYRTRGNWTVTDATFEESAGGIHGVNATGNWTVVNSTLSRNEYDGVLIENASGAWRIESTALRNNGDDGIDASSTTGSWVVNDSKVADSGGAGIEANNATRAWRVTNTTVTRNAAGVDATNASGDWSVRRSAVTDHRYEGLYLGRTVGDWTLSQSRILNNSDGGVAAFSSTGNWTIKDSIIVNNSGTVEVGKDGQVRLTGGAVDASRTSGAWLISNSSLDRNQLGVLATGSANQWTVENVEITDNRYIGIASSASTGNWTVRRSRIINHTNAGIYARSVAGAWTVRNSTLRANGGNVSYIGSVSGERSYIRSYGLDARNTTGAWRVRETVITGAADREDSRSVAVNAVGAAPAGNASYNYWDSSDGPSGDFAGGGVSVVGNLTIRPYYTDDSRTALSSNVGPSVFVAAGNETTLSPGETFSVPVTVNSSDRAVAGVQAELKFDSTVLAASAIDAGGFLSTDDTDTFTPTASIDNENGTVSYAEARQNETGVAGKGVLFAVTFRVRETLRLPASSGLSLRDVVISDIDGRSLPVRVRNGSAVVPENTPPSLDAELVSTTNNVEAPFFVRMIATDPDGSVAEIKLVNETGAVLDEVACRIENCTVTLSATPVKSTWNGETYENRTYRAVVSDDVGASASDSVSTAVYIPGDVNGDGVVDIFDAVVVGRHWQSTRGTIRYSGAPDLNNDGQVNVLDAVMIGRAWQTRAS